MITPRVAARASADPARARLALPSPLEPSAPFLDASGLSAGAGAETPLFARLRALGGADFDVNQRTLLSARGGLDWEDTCRCFVVRTLASRRLGREGVDVWLTLEFLPR